jgi:predicted hotdog family 3-hydroxylacyl-ACP dehydratase
VEIIVLPAQRPTPPSSANKKSLRGRLSAYANPELMAQEQEAWQTAMRDKHEPR